MKETRSGFVAIVGKPNVGKSTLLNAFIGEKIAIVSSKPQTTRTNIMGILTRDETQIVFIDTPGMHKPKTKLSEHMIKSIGQSVGDVDVAVMLVNPFGEITESEHELINYFKKNKLPAILVINKIDLVENKEIILERIKNISTLYDFEAIIPISALTKEGVDDLLLKISEFCEVGPHYFPDDSLTDQPERVIVAEIIREKILNLLYEEVPHGVAVSVESMKERKDKHLMDIEAIIYCERASHKGMIIGKGGVMLKDIASKSRIDIENFFDIKVNLQCWVKVKDDWRNSEGLIRSFGLNN